MKIKERHFLLNLFLLCFAVFLIMGFTLGYETEDPTLLGHTANEININIDGTYHNLGNALRDGTIQAQNNQYVSGRVVGGGIDGVYKNSACNPSCSKWGVAGCRNANNGCVLYCPSGTTQRETGVISYTTQSTSYPYDTITNFRNSYICIAD